MGAPTVAGVRVNRFGQFTLTDVERPLGGGLEVLGRMLRCDALSVTSIQLTNWVQVWVNEDKLGTEDFNPVLTGMVRKLGGSVRIGGAGVFLATRPGTFTVCGLDAVQVDAVRQAWTVASV